MLKKRSAGVRPIRSARPYAVPSVPPFRSRAPLGNAVVPEVNCSNTAAAGSVAAGGRAPVPRAPGTPPSGGPVGPPRARPGRPAGAHRDVGRGRGDEAHRHADGRRRGLARRERLGGVHALGGHHDDRPCQPQHVLELVLAVAAVDRDDDRAEPADGELQDRPCRPAHAEDRDAVAGRRAQRGQAGGDRAGGVAPLPERQLRRPRGPSKRNAVRSSPWRPRPARAPTTTSARGSPASPARRRSYGGLRGGARRRRSAADVADQLAAADRRAGARQLLHDSTPRASSSSRNRGRWRIAPVSSSWSTTTDQSLASTSRRQASTQSSGARQSPGRLFHRTACSGRRSGARPRPGSARAGPGRRRRRGGTGGRRARGRRSATAPARSPRAPASASSTVPNWRLCDIVWLPIQCPSPAARSASARACGAGGGGRSRRRSRAHRAARGRRARPSVTPGVGPLSKVSVTRRLTRRRRERRSAFASRRCPRCG